MTENASNYSADLLLPLLRKAQRGDKLALDSFLLEIQAPVLRYLRRRLSGSRLEPFAEDVLTEVLTRAFRHLHTCKAMTEREVHAWVLTIARNEALRLLERSPYRYALLLGNVDPADLKREASRGNNAGPLPGTFDAGKEDADRSLGVDALLHVLERTQALGDPDLSRLLYERLVENRGWDEIGSTFGISAGAAKRRFQRAQTALAKQIFSGIEELPKSQKIAATELLDRLAASR